MIEVKRHTEGDTRVAKEIPSISAFNDANIDHISDVKRLVKFFADTLEESASAHD